MIKLSKVDLPVPLSPTMAILTASTKSHLRFGDDAPRVHINTKVQLLVKVVLLLTRVREGNIAESDNRRGKLFDILEIESQHLGSVDLFDQSRRLHLVDDLLLGLGLLDQVGISTGRSDELWLISSNVFGVRC